MLIISPIQELLININQKMVLPDYLKGIEEWMQQSEKQIEKVQEAMLNMQTFGQMLFALFIVAFVTAVAEELLFRGCIQTMLTKATKNVHASIWITAILFSAFHMEFYGFLPRLLLGVLFGYFVVWSGSIWPAIWGHFINNGTAVVVTYLYQHKKVTINPSDQHFFNNWGYVISILITLFLLFVYRTISLNRKPQYL
jgi:membrane protease YdiL (CAAX protease family)